MSRHATRVAAIAMSAAAAGALLGAAAAPGPAAALGNGSFAIAPTPPAGSAQPPGSFTVHAVPGQQLTESVSVANLTAAPLRLLLYPADAYTVRSGGGFAVTGIDEAPHDVGAWVSRLPRAVTIPAHRQLNIPFQLRVPANTTPGTHAGGIVAQAAVPERVRVNDNLQTLVYRQVFSRIYATVAGPLSPDLEIDSLRVTHPQPPVPLLTHRTGTITYVLSDTGNTLIEPRVHLRVTGWFGTAVDRTLPATGQLLPGSIAQYGASWSGGPAIGPVHVRLTVQTSEGVTRTADYRYTALPVPFLVVTPVLLAAAALVAFRLLRRRRRRDA